MDSKIETILLSKAVEELNCGISAIIEYILKFYV